MVVSYDLPPVPECRPVIGWPSLQSSSNTSIWEPVDRWGSVNKAPSSALCGRYPFIGRGKFPLYEGGKRPLPADEVHQCVDEARRDFSAFALRSGGSLDLQVRQGFGLGRVRGAAHAKRTIPLFSKATVSVPYSHCLCGWFADTPFAVIFVVYGLADGEERQLDSSYRGRTWRHHRFSAYQDEILSWLYSVRAELRSKTPWYMTMCYAGLDMGYFNLQAVELQEPT